MTNPGRDPQTVLTDEILADAGRQAERIVTRTKRDAKEILDKAQAQAEAERAERLAAARDEADRRRRLALATVPVEVARMRARKVEAALQAVCDEARRRLAAREGFDYRETVVALAADALGRLEGNAFVLELAGADAETLGPLLADAVRRRVGRDGLAVSIAAEAADIAGGVIVRDAEGRQFWDNSLGGRLKRLWPMLRREIAAHVAPDEADGKRPAPPSDDQKES